VPKAKCEVVAFDPIADTGEKPPEDERIPYCTRKSYKPDLPAPAAEKKASKRRSTAYPEFA